MIFGVLANDEFALDPPEEVKDALDRLCEGLPGIRWSDPSQFHLTLRFIGEVSQGIFYELGEALASVSHAPFELALRPDVQAAAAPLLDALASTAVQRRLSKLPGYDLTESGRTRRAA